MKLGKRVFDVSMPMRLTCSTDGLLCLRSATTLLWHIDAFGAVPHQQTTSYRLCPSCPEMPLSEAGRNSREFMLKAVERWRLASAQVPWPLS